MVSNCRGIHPWDRFDFWNKSADLYNSSSLPMVPQANGRERILERGKLFPSQTLFPCQFLSCGHCACFLLLPTAGTYFPCVAIPCSRRAHPFLSHPITGLERGSVAVPWPEKCLLCSCGICRLYVQVLSVFEKR